MLSPKTWQQREAALLVGIRILASEKRIKLARFAKVKNQILINQGEWPNCIVFVSFCRCRKYLVQFVFKRLKYTIVSK